MRDCNWLQALEGDLDTSHVGFLHSGSERAEDSEPGSVRYFALADRAPRFAAVETDYGAIYGAYRPAGPGRLLWRVSQFLFPFYAQIGGILTRAWVPMDDTHTLFVRIDRLPGGVIPAGNSQNPRLVPNSTDWYGRFRLEASAANDYLMDREMQRRNESYTGIEGIFTQDQAVTESMGGVLDRSGEHLGTSDLMVIRIRNRLRRAAGDLQDLGQAPPGVEDPDVYRTHQSGLVILAEDADWYEETKELLRP